MRAWLRGIFLVANEEGPETVQVGRVALDLRWVYWVLERGRGRPIVRLLRFPSAVNRGARIAVDASPWGFGGVLFTSTGKAFYFTEEVTAQDRNLWYPRPVVVES